jgi:hypothetical protein
MHTTSSIPLSELYCACRENEVKTTKQLLRKFTLEQINHIESNGSTALHVACHRNHFDIVQLLLKYGASRSILNLHHLTPYDEASNENVKKLFQRDDSHHFISPFEATTWYIRNPPSWDHIRAMDTYLECQLYTLGLTAMLQHLRKYYLPLVRLPDRQQEQINWFFEQAIVEKNFVPVMRAYTTPTKLHRIVNEHLTKNLGRPIRLNSSKRSLVTSVYYLASILTFSSHDDIPPATCDTFRGLVLSKNELKKYRRGDIIVNTATVSTSTNRNVANMFAGEGQGQKFRRSYNKKHKLQVGLIFRYKFRYNTTRSMRLSRVSEVRDEDEVLIKPLTLFKVVAIKQLDRINADLYEIDLEECDLGSIDSPNMYNVNFNTSNIQDSVHNDDDDDFGLDNLNLYTRFGCPIRRNRETRSEYTSRSVQPRLSRSDTGMYLSLTSSIDSSETSSVNNCRHETSSLTENVDDDSIFKADTIYFDMRDFAELLDELVKS